MNRLSPLRDDQLSLNLDSELVNKASYCELLVEPYLQPFMKHKDRIDDEDFDTNSLLKFGCLKFDQPEIDSFLKPVEIDEPAKKHKRRQKRLIALTKLKQSKPKFRFPSLETLRSTNKPIFKIYRFSRKLKRTGRKRHRLGKDKFTLSFHKTGVSLETFESILKQSTLPTLNSVVSVSNRESRTTRDSCNSGSQQQKPSGCSKQEGTVKKNVKLRNKIDKLKTFWTQRTKIQPQIFHFLVYDYETRRLSFEWVDHSLKGILVEREGEEEKEAEESSSSRLEREYDRGSNNFFRFDD